MSDTSHHIVSYRTYGLILLLLLCLTAVSVAVTQIELTRWATPVALLLATTKTVFVLSVFMHLKFDQKMFRIMATLAFLLVVVVIIFTFLDYGFRPQPITP
ncbi:MAG: cytochrome C oxidase subunit IV family protein [Bacteroidales bacterium]